MSSFSNKSFVKGNEEKGSDTRTPVAFQFSWRGDTTTISPNWVCKLSSKVSLLFLILTSFFSFQIPTTSPWNNQLTRQPSSPQLCGQATEISPNSRPSQRTKACKELAQNLVEMQSLEAACLWGNGPLNSDPSVQSEANWQKKTKIRQVIFKETNHPQSQLRPRVSACLPQLSRDRRLIVLNTLAWSFLYLTSHFMPTCNVNFKPCYLEIDSEIWSPFLIKRRSATRGLEPKPSIAKCKADGANNGQTICLGPTWEKNCSQIIRLFALIYYPMNSALCPSSSLTDYPSDTIHTTWMICLDWWWWLSSSLL